jgi:hypothetical protein
MFVNTADAVHGFFHGDGRNRRMVTFFFGEKKDGIPDCMDE